MLAKSTSNIPPPPSLTKGVYFCYKEYDKHIKNMDMMGALTNFLAGSKAPLVITSNYMETLERP